MKRGLWLVLAFVLFPLWQSNLCAQEWTTGYFRTNSGYQRGSSLDGLPTNALASAQWQTTDPYNSTNSLGSTSLVRFIANWTFGLSTQGYNSVYFGGYNADTGVLPGSTNPSLYRNFTSLGSGPITFSVDFGLIGPTPSVSYTNTDKFGFSLWNGTGTGSLAEIQFSRLNPTSNLLSVDWVGNTPDGTTYKGLNIAYNTLYRLTATLSGTSFNLDLAGLVTQKNTSNVITNYAVVASQNVISNGSLAGGLSASDFGRVSIDWDLASTNNLQPGGNYMIINTVSVVPEPHTFALFGTGLVLVAVARLRRRR